MKGLCHPSDNFGAVLAAAEYAGASGEEFMLALAVSYEIQCRFTEAVPVMAKGFNHATQVAISVAASAGKLFSLSADQIANAISIATADSVSLACIHVEPVLQWKGFLRDGHGCEQYRQPRWRSAASQVRRAFSKVPGSGLHVRAVDTGQMGRSISGDREANGPEKVLLTHSWTRRYRSNAGCKARK